MKNKKYEVIFENGWLNQVHCFNKDEARILAQANAIRNGIDYQSIKSITEIKEYSC